MLGDALNSFLLPEVAGRPDLWSLLKGVLDPAISQMLDVRPLFGRVVRSLGTHDFGRLPELNRHPLLPLQALNLV